MLPYLKKSLFLLFIINQFSCSLENNKKDHLFEKIKPGMYKNQVIQILGTPDTIGRSVVDSSFDYYYYYAKNLVVRGSKIVSFDTAGRVLFTSIDDD